MSEADVGRLAVEANTLLIFVAVWQTEGPSD